MKKLGLKSSLAAMGILLMALLFLGSCTKKEAPIAPTNLKATVDGECIHLSWKKVPRADYYRITVGFQTRDSNNDLADIYEVFLCETSDHTYNDRYPFEKMNYYKIEAVNEYGSSPCSEVSCYYANYANTGVALYPNPTKGNVTIQANGIQHITIVSVLGQVVYDADVNTNEVILNMSQFNAGIYLIRVMTENGEVVKRVVTQ